MRIKEGQTVEWLDDSTLSIVSLPEVQVTYAKSLVTRAELLIRGTEAGVSIDVKVVVSFLGGDRFWGRRRQDAAAVTGLAYC